LIEVFNINDDVFFGILNLNEFSNQYQLTNKRDIETSGKQYLIAKLLGNDVKTAYDDKGKPYLIGDTRHISVSHSHDKLAIIVNNKETTGIDIELIRDKVLKIKHKYLSETELIDAGDDVEKLLIYWAAKETLYKIYGLREVDFNVNLFVNSFTKYNLGTIMGHIRLADFKEVFELNYQIIENYVLVYALKKIT
jgi:4'-phosphopantetheinyl transferase